MNDKRCCIIKYNILVGLCSASPSLVLEELTARGRIWQFLSFLQFSVFSSGFSFLQCLSFRYRLHSLRFRRLQLLKSRRISFLFRCLEPEISDRGQQCCWPVNAPPHFISFSSFWWNDQLYPRLKYKCLSSALRLTFFQALNTVFVEKRSNKSTPPNFCISM